MIIDLLIKTTAMTGMVIIFIIALIVIFAIIGAAIKQKQLRRERKEKNIPHRKDKSYNI